MEPAGFEPATSCLQIDSANRCSARFPRRLWGFAAARSRSRLISSNSSIRDPIPFRRLPLELAKARTVDSASDEVGATSSVHSGARSDVRAQLLAGAAAPALFADRPDASLERVERVAEQFGDVP